MSENVADKDAFAIALEDKMVKLAGYINALQQVVKETEKRAKISEEKIHDVRKELIRTEMEREGIKTAMSTLKENFELEKTTFLGKIKTYVDEIELVKDESKQRYEEAMHENAKSVAALESKITEKQNELDAVQDECLKSKTLVEELQIKTAELEESLKKEIESREVAEMSIITTRDQLEKDKSEEISKLNAAKAEEFEAAKEKVMELEHKFHKLSKALWDKDEMIERYEDERGSVAKIAKLGVNVLGEQTKDSVKKITERSRSLGRQATSRGRSLVKSASSRSKSTTRGRRGKSKSKVEGAEQKSSKEIEKNEKEESYHNNRDDSADADDLTVGKKGYHREDKLESNDSVEMNVSPKEVKIVTDGKSHTTDNCEMNISKHIGESVETSGGVQEATKEETTRPKSKKTFSAFRKRKNTLKENENETVAIISAE